MITDFTGPISYFDAHVYFKNQTEASKAQVLREMLLREFHNIRAYDLNNNENGEFKIQICTKNEFATLLPWLTLNRNDLSVYIEPKAEDGVINKQKSSIWLGDKF